MSQDRKQLIRLAAKRPVGDPVRRVLLGELQKQSAYPYLHALFPGIDLNFREFEWAAEQHYGKKKMTSTSKEVARIQNLISKANAQWEKSHGRYSVETLIRLAANKMANRIKSSDKAYRLGAAAEAAKLPEVAASFYRRAQAVFR